MALKILKRGFKIRGDSKLKAEVYSLANLEHPNIINLHGFKENGKYIQQDGSVE